MFLLLEDPVPVRRDLKFSQLSVFAFVVSLTLTDLPFTVTLTSLIEMSVSVTVMRAMHPSIDKNIRQFTCIIILRRVLNLGRFQPLKATQETEEVVESRAALRWLP